MTKSEPATDQEAVIEIADVGHFETFIASDDRVLVDFSADWCGPCHQLAPRIESVGQSNPSQVAKVDIDAHPNIAQRYTVRSVPTVIVYQDGAEIDRFIGVQSTATLADALE